MTPVTVACVEYGNYLGRGEEYVRKLGSMVARHLARPHQFVCLRPQERGMEGWWAKIALFKPGQFSGRVLYLDLDTVVVGALDPLLDTPGILHLAQWGWKKNDYGSGVMVWDAGDHHEIWDRFSLDVPRTFRGDQDWMTHLGGWGALSPVLCRSYRYHCKSGPTPGASVVCFHGKPKPHELGGWVKEAWQ